MAKKRTPKKRIRETSDNPRAERDRKERVEFIRQFVLAAVRTDSRCAGTVSTHGARLAREAWDAIEREANG